MKRLLFIVFLFLTLPSLASAACSGSSPTWTAASVSDTDVAACITAASSGDTIHVPAGSATWTTQVTLGSASGDITLTGAGTCSGSPLTCTNTTNITVSTSPSLAGLLVGGTSSFKNISGFTFIQGSTSHGNGMVKFTCGTPFNNVSFRFHHNRIVLNSGITNRGLWVEGCYGLTDHNLFESTVAQLAISTTGSPTSTDAGWTPWQQPLSLGTINAHYIEDNTINYPLTKTDSACDAYGGARYVVRHNTVNNADCGGHHGTDSGGNRGPVSFEWYANTYTNNTAFTYNNTIRSGTGVIFDNIYNGTGTWGGARLIYYRACDVISTVTGWGNTGCDGTNWELMGVKGSTGSTLCSRGLSSGATTNAAGYAIGATTITLASAGTGSIVAGDKVKIGAIYYGVTTGDADVSNGGTIVISPLTVAIPAVATAIGNGGYRLDATTGELLGAESGTYTKYFDNAGAAESGSFGYPCRDQPGQAPGQITEPIYFWNNGTGTQSPGIAGVDNGADNCHGHGVTHYLLSGRDYINNGTTPKPGYTAFTYPHPLQGEEPPPPVPDTPQNLRITGSTDSHAVTLAWPASTDATTVGYYVLMGTTTGVYNFTPIATRTSALAVSTHSPLTQATITNLPADTYYFTVVGFSSDFTRSEYATEVSTTITALARGGLTQARGTIP